jgi:hypothetical protein
MKLNKQRLLEHIIEEGIQDALRTRKEGMNDEVLLEHISDHIWMGLDYYFNFEED